MKFFKFILAIFILLCNISYVYSMTLNEDIRKFLRKEDPKVEIRFDGLITLSNGIRYLPLTPALVNDVKQLSISYTYPSNKKKLKELPQIILFNNNYALLKLIELKNNKVTFSPCQNIPMTIKTGLLPQNMLVPSGLIVPDHLKGIMGNLDIPLESEVLPQKQFVIAKKIYINPIEALKNTLYFVRDYNSKIINVFDSSLLNPIYSFTLNEIPKDIKAINNDSLLYIISTNKKTIDVISVDDEKIVRQIDLDLQPNEMVIDNNKNVAYISSDEDNYIFKIDNQSVMLIEKIKVLGSPTKICLSDDGSKLFYIDKLTSILYFIELKENYKITALDKYPNVSKILNKGDDLYILVRTRNILDHLKLTSSPETKEEYIINQIRKGRTQEDVSKELAKSEKLSTRLKFSNKYKKTNVDIFKKQYDNSSTENKSNTDIRAQFKKSINVSPKPVDMIIYDDLIFVLSASNNEINIINSQSGVVTKKIKLPTLGFCNNIIPIDNSNLAIITNISENSYIVFDLKKQAVLQKVPINTKITGLTLVKKRDRK